MVRFQELSDWLNWQQQLHPKTIDLDLQRVFCVAKAMELLKPATPISHHFSAPLNTDARVVTVAGTNGKGSCLKTIEQCLIAQHKSVGVYTSPHLHHYCERICINGEAVGEDEVCKAFSTIDRARDDVSLSYFEFGTLAALWLFLQHRVDFVLLEVGLGGRLDAVNIVDADVMAVTSIGIDHQQWLGNDRNTISQEKLGIARQSRPLFIAEKQLTPALRHASNLYAVKQVDKHFSFCELNDHIWQYSEQDFKVTLPTPNLPISSVATGLAILSHLNLLPNENVLSQQIADWRLPGRFEQLTIDDKIVIFDVAHNVAAAQLLAVRLAKATNDESSGIVRAVVAMLDDKEHQKIIDTLSPYVQAWYLGDLSGAPRALPAKQLMGFFDQANQAVTGMATVFIQATIEEAFNMALSEAGEHDRIIVFGSFFTVAAIQTHLDSD